MSDPEKKGRFGFRSTLRITTTKYLISEYAKLILLTLSGLLVVYAIVDLFEIGRLLYRYRAALSFLPKLLFLNLPLIIYHLIPVAVLIGTLISTGLLIRNNELVVLRICGFTYLRLFAVIAIPCAGFAATSFLIGEKLVPRTIEVRNKIIVQEIRKIQRAAVQTTHGIWIPGISSIFQAESIRQEERLLQKVRVYRLDEAFRLHTYIEAEEGQYDKKEWVFRRGKSHQFKEGDLFSVQPFEELRVRLPESFDDFEIFKEDPDTMSFGHLWTLTRKLMNEGYDAREYLVALHTRLSFPSLALPLSLLGFALAHMGGGRKKTLGGTLFLAVLASFFAWTLFALTIILGRHGLLPAEIAAWLIHLPLLSAGLIILARQM
ncbi:MAG: LptF/LptG family permease [Nitrospirae bacterium]|nr:LptF/LptG family permease [Nitrospirota bacterium]